MCSHYRLHCIPKKRRDKYLGYINTSVYIYRIHGMKYDNHRQLKTRPTHYRSVTENRRYSCAVRVIRLSRRCPIMVFHGQTCCLHVISHYFVICVIKQGGHTSSQQKAARVSTHYGIIARGGCCNDTFSHLKQTQFLRCHFFSSD